jgi:hypothetical protein
MITRLLACLITLVTIYGTDRVMALTITGAPPSEATRFLGGGWFLYLDGDIELDSGEKFEEYLKINKVPAYSLVIFNSPGGNPIGGMKLGRAIRKYGLETSVGRQTAKVEKEIRATEPGECYSACALAYMGGKFRFLSGDSKIGVHRFYFTEKTDDAVDFAQIASAAIVNYLSDMDIDPKFLSVMTLASGKQIYTPSKAVLEEFNVVNNGFTKTIWTFQNFEKLIYLKGERDTRYGINKFILACTQQPTLYIIFDPQGREGEVLKMKSQMLVVNGLYFRLSPLELKQKDGLISGAYTLSKDIVEKLYNAKTVGMIYRWSDSAPIFLGFDSMPFDGAIAKLDAIFKNCDSQPSKAIQSDALMTLVCTITLNKSGTSVRYTFRKRTSDSSFTEIEFDKNGTKEYTNTLWTFAVANKVLALNYSKDTRYTLLVSLDQSGYATLNLNQSILGSGNCQRT